MTWLCPTCGEESEKVYRCTECGADLAEKGPRKEEDAVSYE